MTDPAAGGSNPETSKKPTAEQIMYFKALNPGVSDDDIVKYINRR